MSARPNSQPWHLAPIASAREANDNAHHVDALCGTHLSHPDRVVVMPANMQDDSEPDAVQSPPTPCPMCADLAISARGPQWFAADWGSPDCLVWVAIVTPEHMVDTTP